jgi:hypothetical protein
LNGIGNDSERRREAHFRRLGTRSPQCRWPGCEEVDPEALTGAYPEIFCQEHLDAQSGKQSFERHHPFGQHNDAASVPIPTNDHRVLSDFQRDWPERTLRNPDHSPLRKAAAMVRGWLDVLKIIIERILGWVPAFLERLDDRLTALFGASWWNGPDFEGLS